MAVATLDRFESRATDKPRRSGLLSRFLRALVVSREREARRYVNSYLLSLDDKTLAKLGYKRADVVKSDAGVAYRY